MMTKKPSPNKKKEEKLPERNPIDKIKLVGAVATYKSRYYKAKEESAKKRRHREMADYHEDMADKGIHEDYHKEKAEHHRAQIAKIDEKEKASKKDIGPMTVQPGALGI